MGGSANHFKPAREIAAGGEEPLAGQPLSSDPAVSDNSTQSVAGSNSPADDAESSQPSVPNGGGRWRMRLAFAWISAVLLAYYLVHLSLFATFFPTLVTPTHHLILDWQTPLRAAGHLVDLVVASWVLALGMALGLRIWRWLCLPLIEDSMRVALAAGLGLGALGLATFALGIPGWLSSWTTWGCLGLLSILCVRDGWWLLRWLAAQARRIRQTIRSGSWLDRLLWGYILLTVLLMVLAALLPPTAWDALMYHLAAPAVDHARGQVLPDPANPQGYQPQLVEMLYLDALFLRGDGMPALLHVGFGLLSILVLVTVARRLADPARGTALALRAAALFLSIPSLVLVLGWPYIDGALLFYELAALCALLCWWNAAWQQRLGWLLLTGVLLGLGLDTKYTAVFALGGIACLALWRAWQRDGIRKAFGQTVLLGVAAFVIGSPWLIRNLLLTRDPLFPYHLGHLFPAGPLWDDGLSQRMTEGSGWGWAQVWRLLTLPLEVTLYGQQGAVEFDATLGPLLLLLLPLGLLTVRIAFPKRQRQRQSVFGQPVLASDLDTPASQAPLWTERQIMGVFLAFAAFQMLCWDVELLSVHFARQSRLFFPLFAALTLPAGLVWMRVRFAPMSLPGLHRLVSLVVALTLALTLLGQVDTVLGNSNTPYLLGLQSHQAYLSDHLDPYYAAMGAINALPDSAHVLFLWEVRSYYASPVHVVQPDPFLGIFDYYVRHCPTAEQLAQCFRRAGFTHVLLYAQGLQLVLDGRPGDESSAKLAVLWTLLAQDARLVYHDDEPLVRASAGPPTSDEQMLGARGWYRLYTLTGS